MAISALTGIHAGDYDAVVDALAADHRRKEAVRSLMRAGDSATPALRRGLRHANPRVIMDCCRVLDHFLDPEAIPELMANLDHADARVRAWAMHALACDRCKEGVCRPGEDEVIPIAIDMLEHDRAVGVRQQAAGMLGPSVHRRDDVRAALMRAHADGPSPVVRKIAGWWVPGGPRYEALLPRENRRKVRKKRSRFKN